MTGVQYVINDGFGWFVDGGLGTVLMDVCVAICLITDLDGDAYVMKLMIDKVIELGFLYRCVNGCNDSKIEGLVTGLRYGINDRVGRFFVSGLVTGFDIDADGITPSIDEVIALGFQVDLLIDIIMAILGVLW